MLASKRMLASECRVNLRDLWISPADIVAAIESGKAVEAFALIA
jgi:hypothetical protein